MELNVEQEVTRTETVTVDVPLSIREHNGAYHIFVGDWAWEGPLSHDFAPKLRAVAEKLREAAERYPLALYPGDNHHEVIRLALAGEPIKPPEGR